MNGLFECSSEVRHALAAKQPVLALESTLITHGLPNPINIELALELEDIVRKQGVTPATIAVVNGKIKIGLTTKELAELTQASNCIKASIHDLAYAISKKISAGTTVAATAYCAQQVGINVFATGGIGGVHRGEGMDISADLLTISKTPVAVICSGAKAILDLASTVEYLETLSVPIIGFNTECLPAFYSSQSSIKLTQTCNSITDLAHYLQIHWQLRPSSGVIIANPINDEDEIAALSIEPAIATALQQAKDKKIVGKAITPFLLQSIRELTQDQSLAANCSLLRTNALLGAKLAKSLALTSADTLTRCRFG